MSYFCFTLFATISWQYANAFSKVPAASRFVTKTFPIVDDSRRLRNNFALKLTVTSRIQRIRDISLTKQILNDLTAAEFALKVESKALDSNIDYEMLVSNLNRSLELLSSRRSEMNDNLSQRIASTRNELLNVFEQVKSKTNVSSVSFGTYSISKKKSIPQTNPITSQNKTSEIPSLKFFIREDGSVDWEEAIASGMEVAKYGTELWERLNGKEVKEGLPSISELLGQVQAKLPETEETKRLNEELLNARKMYENAIDERNNVLSQLRRLRKDGSTIENKDIQSLKKYDTRVKELEKRVNLYKLNLDMERICLYIEQELQSTVSPANDQRLLVAEVSLLDKQLSALMGGLTPISIETNGENGIGSSSSREDDMLSLIDEDELLLVGSEVEDLKSRLGLEAQKANVNWGTLGVYVTDTINKIKEGLNFFGLGTRILIGDVQYAWVLLLKAIQGYTLKPREVNTLRRTGKDLLTMIPFTIILIIPLSPVGHVLVFSFIQRYFPDFFPSGYTEKRQNLWRLYSEIERKSDDELLGPPDAVDPLQAIKDLLESIVRELKNIFKLEPSPSSNPIVTPSSSPSSQDQK